MLLTVKNKEVDVSAILDFIENNLTNIIRHLNMLSNIFSEYARFLETVSTVEIGIDFSENLTLFYLRKGGRLYILGSSNLKAT